ncbi:glycoside hydrolase family 2 protein [Tunicatimonas pelagia]|uniref:glycoside hydrolase family 2 protein n=1 Tax=Tunicatimonas pelagia TaxID=931531 RepID=UPI0026666111|nr:sugar-binding domain-containing protein [Tunicatimonas pelagia]WKN41047.1 glycoside hydrolase family 2 TIM barrel-domain containing protein [Tunicatimonas pelagia]
MLSKIVYLFAYFSIQLLSVSALSQDIPLPEHPRPDFERPQWQNLNGTWQFAFDSLNQGLSEQWFAENKAFDEKITVPFPWGSPLSGVEDQADIAWYQREMTVDPAWQGQRTFIVIGASDWQTDVWLDGQHVGKHQGGYVPFSFELTEHLTYGQPQQLVIRVDDAPRAFALRGKQLYGNAKGIWQTVYLEARGSDYLDQVQFTPGIDRQKVIVTAYLPDYAQRDIPLSLRIATESEPIRIDTLISAGQEQIEFSVPIPQPRLWSLNDPYLYTAEVTLGTDTVRTYFGMRTISIENLPGTDYPYVALNGQPVYLQMALDQAYHPEGFYTFPSDTFIRREVERSKAIGLNGIRPHIKVPIPRKLYWADKLGVLIMADLPNYQDPRNERSEVESEYTLREMIKRDYNHPSIFSWVVFNESWGLRTDIPTASGNTRKVFQPDEQQYAAGMYYLTKSLDTTRLVDDNSIHSYWCAEHTVTDLNSSHDYLMGVEWEHRLKVRSDQSHLGSTFQYADGFVQGNVPSINAECGNVWGYEGTTGDVDWSYDYHRMMNTFRKYPKMAGWLYTEHHDVIKEWNGYWRADRSLKFTGVDELVEGMTMNDFHALVYLSTGNEICQTVPAGATVDVPLYLSSMTEQDLGDSLAIRYELQLTNTLAETSLVSRGTRNTAYRPYIQDSLSPLALQMPEQKGLAILKLYLDDAQGNTVHRNFMHFEVVDGANPADVQTITVGPADFSEQQWSQQQWAVLDGKKVNGTGSGHFTYTFALPNDLAISEATDAYFLAELSAKQLFIKDLTDAEKQARGLDLDYRKYPDSNPNAYPMSDEMMFPSEISISVNGRVLTTVMLPDDPADHRGVLSWHHQSIPEPEKDQHDLDNWWYTLSGTLHEAGSYGYLTKVAIPLDILRQAQADSGTLSVQIQTRGEGGVAVYGQSFGRYPLDPTLVLD